MADILLSTIAGSAIPGGTKTRTVSGVILISSGASGTIATISCPANRVAKLTYLVSNTSVETGMTIDVGGSSVASSISIDFESNPFAVATTGSIILGNRKSSDLFIAGDLGEDILIKKDSGSTVNSIRYAYQLLE